MAGLSKKTALRAGAAVPLLLGLLTLSGCTDSYPEDLDYPLRGDPIVDKPPEKDPTQLDPPGTLEQWIDSLPAKGGKLTDPHANIQKQQLAKVNEHLSKGHFDLSDEDRDAMGLTSKPENADAAKKALEERRDKLQNEIKRIESAVAGASKDIHKALTDLFGTPAKPKVKVDDADESRLDAKTLAEGSVLYRRHCLHCHGLTGDGRGPTAPWVNPHPRDYRMGKFKFTSTTEGVGVRKARREDLLRTLKMGIEGTSMPSFGLLDEEKELQPLISYVMHLSMRGQVERDVLLAVLAPDAEKDQDIGELAEKRLNLIWKQWKSTEKKPVKINDVPSFTGKPAGQLSGSERKELDESIRRGFVQFTTGSAKCRQCHNDFGRANDYKFDEWGTIARPANLTAGMYRGGRRPLDLYYRIFAGINGSQMPAHDTVLKPDQVWDIVNFLEALPYRNMLPPEVKKQVYGEAAE